MKVAFLLAFTCVTVTTRRTQAAAIEAPLDLITLDDLSPSDRKHLEYLEQHFGRPKRSGSGDILNSIKSVIGQGIKSKLGQIAKSSASASGHFSSASSGHGHGHSYHHHHDVPETYDHKSFDFWSLKKSILNTLLQAVKAIKGGVIAIKGQLIKGGGHLISAKGKLISAKGEAITNLGKNIASSAVLSPYHGHSASGHADIDYSSHGHYEHPSAPSGPAADVYHGSPSAPGAEYNVPDYHHSDDKEPHGGHGGILILKKIPHTGHDIHTSSAAEEHKIPDFKPLEHSGPSFGTIFSKLFAASSSSNPHEPSLFGHESHHESHHDSHHHAPSHSSVEYHAPETAPGSTSSSHLVHDVPPSPSHSTHWNADNLPSTGFESSHTPTGSDVGSSVPTKFGDSFGGTYLPTASNIGHDTTHTNYQFLLGANQVPTAADILGGPSNFENLHGDGGKPPSTSYGTPFEDAPNYLNYAEFGSASKKHPATIKHPNSLKENPEYQSKPTGSTQYLTPDAHMEMLPNTDNIPPTSSGFSVEFSNPTGNSNYELYPKPSSPTKQHFSGVPPINQVPPLRTTSSSFLDSATKYLKHQSVPSTVDTFHSSSSTKFSKIRGTPNYKHMPFSGVPPFINQVPSISTSVTNKHKNPQTYDVVQSVSYELGPNGPKRLT